MAKRKYRWFVEPIGGYANESIASFLDSSVMSTRELEAKDSEDGRRHQVYECTTEQRRVIEKTRGPYGLTVRIWVQEGNGKFREWKPEEIRAKSREKRSRLPDEHPLLPFPA